jgi:hypothetical protein
MAEKWERVLGGATPVPHIIYEIACIGGGVQGKRDYVELGYCLSYEFVKEIIWIVFDLETGKRQPAQADFVIAFRRYVPPKFPREEELWPTT